jgi:hypothetical protein
MQSIELTITGNDSNHVLVRCPSNFRRAKKIDGLICGVSVHEGIVSIAEGLPSEISGQVAVDIENHLDAGNSLTNFLQAYYIDAKGSYLNQRSSAHYGLARGKLPTIGGQKRSTPSKNYA